ncbi:GNAT family N-acetyltransferase [Beijerinckia mobilis]|uniref:GNAT family N-acetyltransferase n=1 Tax=Beijerinckia mobilis TaxID=231434 RepID=UPI00054D63BF|nr:GNAT family N-acetyltransferase [Beijerinckia mobilis]
MIEDVITIRAAREKDAASIAAVHDSAWRDAYRGIIPGRELERMIARRGPAWWHQAIVRGSRLLLIEWNDAICGYACYGRNRVPSMRYGGEIFELYIAPEYQGAGFGKRLFQIAAQDLSAHGYANFLVWALAENERGMRFYEAQGGIVVRQANERFGGETRARVAFAFENQPLPR